MANSTVVRATDPQEAARFSGDSLLVVLILVKMGFLGKAMDTASGYFVCWPKVHSRLGLICKITVGQVGVVELQAFHTHSCRKLSNLSHPQIYMVL